MTLAGGGSLARWSGGSVMRGSVTMRKISDQNYYTVWRTTGHKQVFGSLPLRVEGKGDNKTFTVTLRNPKTGTMEEKRFTVFKDKTRMRVTPPEDIGQYETSEDDE